MLFCRDLPFISFYFLTQFGKWTRGWAIAFYILLKLTQFLMRAKNKLVQFVNQIVKYIENEFDFEREDGLVIKFELHLV